MSNSQSLTYRLEKYSKAVHKSRLQSQSTQGPGANELEWQHHTPADLQLQLELKSSQQGSYESVRVKVVWAKGRATQDPIGSVANEIVVYVRLVSLLAPKLLPYGIFLISRRS